MAIQTVVAKFDEKLVRTAIEVELERGGQAYFVHNRVETIFDMATMIREQCARARVSSSRTARWARPSSNASCSPS